jgi:cob(I)alamin adenosyltransferase
MVQISKVYTKVGDQGSTHLGDGSAVCKSSIRVTAYGTVDEANALLGRAIATIQCPAPNEYEQMRLTLISIQNDLFDVGADLCAPITESEQPGDRLRVLSSQADRIESMIDRYNEPLPPLNSFVLPGGTQLSAELHVVRTVVRRAERCVAELLKLDRDQTNPETLVYLNRLSDLFFVLSRVVNDNGAMDILWEPGATRPLDEPHSEGGSTT